MQSKLEDGSRRFENTETCYFRKVSMSLVVKSANVYGKYLVSLILRVVTLGGPFWPVQATYTKFACTLFNPFTRCLKRLPLLMARMPNVSVEKQTESSKRE